LSYSAVNRGVLRGEPWIAAHHPRVGVERDPLTERHLHARDLGEYRPTAWSDERLAIRLAPPTSGGLVLEHRIEFVHPHEAEPLHGAVEHRIEDPPGAADGAVGDEDRAARDRVGHEVMVADELQGIGARLAVHHDTDHDAIRGYLGGARGDHRDAFGLLEDPVRRHDEVGRVGDPAGRQGENRRGPSAPPRARRRWDPPRHHHEAERADRPAQRVQRVGDLDAPDAL